jgi:hypothetical protein
MKYAREMYLVALIHIPSYMKIDLAIQKLIGGDTQTHRHTERMVVA